MAGLLAKWPTKWRGTATPPRHERSVLCRALHAGLRHFLQSPPWRLQSSIPEGVPPEGGDEAGEVADFDDEVEEADAA